ncbi:MAG: YihY/virulence factor BrkB family protein [Salinisphaera sp.]|jgi:membrane protein|nr:YihY/virulence factor BrkB family protein [Salinisphaera sp.]
MLGAIGDRYDRWVWQPDLEHISGPRRWLLIAARIVAALISDIQAGDITMRAMGLVYTSLVSLVPMLALAFSLLKAFGVNNALRPVLQRFLSPLGPQSAQIIDKIVDFVQNVQVGVLGAIGMVALIWSVLSLIQKVEAGCNYIWHVRAARSLGRRVTEYLSVLIAGPLVILAATSMTASVTSNAAVGYLYSVEPFGEALYIAGRLVPYLLYSIGFTLLFAFMPNTRVRLLPAIGGGIFAGVLWQTATFAFALFASNAGNVNAIYSSFAILILLLIWLYVSWMIVLTGCRVAFLLQHNERLTRGPYPPHLGEDARERLALMILGLVARRFLDGAKPWQADHLASALRVAPDHVNALVDDMVAAGLIMETGDERSSLMPRRDIEQVQLNDALDTIRRGDPAACPRPRSNVPVSPIEAWHAAGERARRDVFRGLTLRELALSLDESSSKAPIDNTSR